MTTPIFDSIINGVLSPTMIEQYSVPISRISHVLTRLPDSISQLESLLEIQLGNYVRFDFAEEKAAPLFISGEVYHPIPNYKYDISINPFRSRTAGSRLDQFGKIFWCQTKAVSIEPDIPVFAIILRNKPYELVENLTSPAGRCRNGSIHGFQIS